MRPDTYRLFGGEFEVDVIEVKFSAERKKPKSCAVNNVCAPCQGLNPPGGEWV